MSHTPYTPRRVLFLHDPRAMDSPTEELAAVLGETPWALAESVLDVEPGDLVIPRMFAWPHPRRLQADVHRRGGELLNGLRAYVYADHAASWSSDLDGLTPRTWTRLEDLPEVGPFIVKGAHADKGRWSRMFAPDRRAAIDLWHTLSADTGMRGAELVVRAYVPLRELGPGLGGCPPAEEYRVFCCDGEVLAAGSYWDPGDCELAPGGVASIPHDWLRTCAARVREAGSIRFHTLDVARTAAGDWTVIEVSDGCRAGLTGVDPVALYRVLASHLARS